MERLGARPSIFSWVRDRAHRPDRQSTSGNCSHGPGSRSRRLRRPGSATRQSLRLSSKCPGARPRGPPAGRKRFDSPCWSVSNRVTAALQIDQTHGPSELIEPRVAPRPCLIRASEARYICISLRVVDQLDLPRLGGSAAPAELARTCPRFPSRRTGHSGPVHRPDTSSGPASVPTRS